MSGSSRRRQSSSEDEGGGANWMDTYGDLVTLLLCFFVLLFSFSSVDAQKWESLVGAFSGTTAVAISALDPNMAVELPIASLRPQGMPIESDAADIDGEFELPSATQAEIIEQNFDELVDNIGNYILEHGLDAEILPNYEEYSLIVRFKDRVFFDSAEAVVLPEAIPVLDHVIQMFSNSGHLFGLLRIEGHTDNVPIRGRYRSNWELSGARAISVLEYIVAHSDIDPAKLAVGGYSEYHFIAPNDTAEGRAQNRRVDFIVEGFRSVMPNN